MQTLESIDRNFKVDTGIDIKDICFYSVLQAPFTIYGVAHTNGRFRRMPEAVAQTVSPGVHYLHANTSGGRVRFKTNSQYIAISAQMDNIGKMSHFPLTGSAGFDVYVGAGSNKEFITTFRLAFTIADGFHAIHHFKTRETREITINFPLYSDVCDLYIGLQKDASLEAPAPYSIQTPIVFYGSSITQGGCASRPGNSYTTILSNRFDFDFINLGFSGSAKGEQAMAYYIAGLDMSMFILDYDHNAPNAEHLENTHHNFYQIVRKAHPQIPIIMMTSVSKSWVQEQYFDRREVIYHSYLKAKENGDENVYFWDGHKEFEPYENYGTVEGCHPNDFGFYGMAESLSRLFQEILLK